VEGDTVNIIHAILM